MQIKGKVYHKTVGFGESLGLVLLCHGAYADFPEGSTDYRHVFDSLATCLASQGYIAISIRHRRGSRGSGDGAARADEDIFSSLVYLVSGEGHPMLDKFNLRGRPIALVGHSEAGRGALYAAKRFSSWTKITTVIAIAPTRPSRDTPKSGIAKNILVLQGTHDGDSPVGGQSVAIYEHVNAWQKNFVWMWGASHSRLLEPAPGSIIKNDIFHTAPYSMSEMDAQSWLGAKAHRTALTQYVSMYLLWTCSGVSLYKDVFRGAAKIDWASEDNETSAELNAKFRARPRYLHGLGKVPLAESTEDVRAYGFFRVDNNAPVVYPDNPPPWAAATDLHWTALNQETEVMALRWDILDVPSPGPPRIVVTCNPEVMALSPTAIEFYAIILGGMAGEQPQSEGVVVEANIHVDGEIHSAVSVPIWPSLNMSSPTPNQVFSVTRSMLASVRVQFDEWSISKSSVPKITDFSLSFQNTAQTSGSLIIGGFRAAFTS